MKILVGCFVFLYLLNESCGDSCSYRCKNLFRSKYKRCTYSCQSDEYCCGERSCCDNFYTRWYFWLAIGLASVGGPLVWFLYRYYCRPRHSNVAPVQTNAAVTTQGRPAGITHIAMNVAGVNAPQPVNPLMTTTAGTTMQHTAFLPPSCPPPAYSSTMKGSTTFVTS